MSKVEDQMLECEALGSIYGDDFTLLAAPSDATQAQLKVRVTPSSQPVHVTVDVLVDLPLEYPDADPVIRVESVKGINDVAPIIDEIQKRGEGRSGEPRIYDLIEAAREWIEAHNEPQGEGSAYDEMMKRQRAKEKEATVEDTSKKAYRPEDDPSIAGTKKARQVSASAEDEEIRKKREGTPVTVEAFLAWRDRFEKEMAAEAKRKLEELVKAGGTPNLIPGAIVIDMATGKPKLTGRQLFESGSATVATAEAEAESESPLPDAIGGVGVREYVVDAELYMGGDELDDLDLDDDDDEEFIPGEDDDEDDDDDDDDEDYED